MLQKTIEPGKRYSRKIWTGRQKRNSCLFYRKDTIYRTFRKAVCEKYGLKEPSLLACYRCKTYAPCMDTAPAGKQRQKKGAAKKAHYMLPRTNPMMKKRCAICGASFETRSLMRNRCTGRCRKNLHNYFDHEGTIIETIV